LTPFDKTPVEQRRSFDRLVNFTDAVVAIAITLQLLPLVDIDGPTGEQTVWDVLSMNYGQINAFLLSFIIVIVMWLQHNRVFNVMKQLDGTIVWLNIGWLASIAFLPWPAAMYGDAASLEIEGHGGAAMLYWFNLALISIFGSLIAWHAHRHPKLLEKGVLERGWLAHQRLARVRSIVYPSYFILIGLISEVVPAYAGWLALGLIPIGILTAKVKG
jgi:uncharacterized membrane protein